jgi:hypothetical protein
LEAVRPSTPLAAAAFARAFVLAWALAVALVLALVDSRPLVGDSLPSPLQQIGAQAKPLRFDGFHSDLIEF